MSDDRLCIDDRCPACGAPCQRRQDHDGQHECINCGTRWWTDEDEDEEGEGLPV
jgi:uncharacterized Zn finger protein (UPF0148 family)